MREGKVAERVLRRSVLGQLNHNAPEEKMGMEAAVSLAEGEILAPQRAVFDPVNSLAAAGVKAEALTISLVMPESMEEKELKAFMKETDSLCSREHVFLLAGHTAVSSAVSQLLVTSCAFGHSPETDSEEEALFGMDLVCAGAAAREGTALIARSRREKLTGRYPSAFIDEAAALYDDASMTQAAGILRAHGSRKIRSAGEGGVFGGLWQLAAAMKVGLLIDLTSIPIRQHTIEVCEFFQINPYMLMSGGCLLAAARDGFGAVEALRKKGIEAGVIGKVTDSNDRIVRYDGETRFLEPPKQDEYYRFLHNDR